jgi:phosphate transport system substrate-binding protein
MRTKRFAVLLAVLAIFAAACGNSPEESGSAADDAGTTTDTATADDAADAGGGELDGSIEIDGSSTVVPLTDAVAEDYAAEEPGVTVNVGFSGTGGGFERFCNGETDVSNASRPIKDEEAETCSSNGIEFTEMRVATDALTVVTSADTDWVDCLTVEELNHVYRAEDPAQTWADVNGDWPDTPIDIYSPGADSGTYDYFSEAILDDEAPRQDANFQEDDNILVQGVSGTQGAVGYFGYSYYEENADSLKAIAVDGGEGCVEPSVETAMDGSYAPLARPLFIYVSNEALERPEVGDFVTYYLDNVQTIAEEVQFIPPTDEQVSEARSAYEAEVGA